MRTAIPPLFSGEDLQRLLTLALTAPVSEDHRPDPERRSAPEVHPAPVTTPSADAWDERW